VVLDHTAPAIIELLTREARQAIDYNSLADLELVIWEPTVRVRFFVFPCPGSNGKPDACADNLVQTLAYKDLLYTRPAKSQSIVSLLYYVQRH
jgi:hypothetical protein